MEYKKFGIETEDLLSPKYEVNRSKIKNNIFFFLKNVTYKNQKFCRINITKTASLQIFLKILSSSEYCNYFLENYKYFL